MMTKSKRLTRKYKQTLYGKKEDIFELLCPVREKEWLRGWDYKMIYSESGFAEKGCIFETDNDFGSFQWVMTKYDKNDFTVIQSYPPRVRPENKTNGASLRYFFNPSSRLGSACDVLNVTRSTRITLWGIFFTSTVIVYPLIIPSSSSFDILDSISSSVKL